MLMTYFICLMATVSTSNGMASLGNGSIKKLSFRAKMAKYCSQTPSPCRFKMEVKKKQQEKQKEEKFHLNDNEIDREEEKLRKKARKIIANSHMQCHFTEKANFRIDHLAKNIKQKQIEDIAKDLKNLIQELLLQPQAIIICQPKDKNLGDLLNNDVKNDDNKKTETETDENSRSKVNVNDVTSSAESDSQNDVQYSDHESIYTKPPSDIITTPNNAQNLPWKKDNNAEKKTFKHTSPNHQSLPWKDETNADTVVKQTSVVDLASLLRDTKAEIKHVQKETDNSLTSLLDYEDVQRTKLERLIKLLMKNANTQ